ncbi:TolC family protein [Gynurincola endophyticus]|uniref:TolC family protein n=1 Tax=Gynurincola endophyticus TaxID=2479004 RepID=UPI000F8E8F3C|nr:TolC family protein [Gynurincola endophyticus]
MKPIVLILALFSFVTVKAQDPTGRTQQEGVNALDSITKEDAKKLLVAMALKNPNYEISLAKIRSAKWDVAKAKGAWLGMFEATGNLNEYTLKGSGTGAVDPVTGLATNNSLFFPRYNFSLRIPLDMFTGKANDVKIKKEALTIAEREKEVKEREIKKEILIRFEDLLMHKEKLEIQARILQVELSDYTFAENEFKLERISSEEFKQAESGYFELRMRYAELNRNYNVAKIELEELVGSELDNILRRL